MDYFSLHIEIQHLAIFSRFNEKPAQYITSRRLEVSDLQVKGFKHMPVQTCAGISAI